MKVNDVTLETKHLLWVIEWALEKCGDYIEEYEVKTVAHERFKDEPLRTRWGTRESRTEKLASINEYLTQYRAIHAFLVVAKDQAHNRSAKEFADGMKEMFNH